MYYKITKIVRALWLAERRVCMRVCKHGCDFMFCFSRANHASTNLKKCFELKTSTSLLYSPISSSAETWKIFRNMLCQFFFTWAEILSEKKTVIWKASFLQNKDCFVYKTSRLVSSCLLISAPNKRVLLFFLGKLFYKSNRKLWSVSWRQENARKGPNTTFGAQFVALPLVKPVV